MTFKSARDVGKLEVNVRPGKDGYPGITITPDGPAWNLSSFGHVDLRLVNTGPKPIFACLRVDNDGDWKLDPWNGEHVSLQPGATDTIRVRFGYSWGKPGFALNSAKVSRVLVFLGTSNSVQSFRVESIEAGGFSG